MTDCRPLTTSGGGRFTLTAPRQGITPGLMMDRSVRYRVVMRITDYALNRLNVLKAIRRSGPMARTELQNLTGLASGTITHLTGELLAHGLVIESKADTTRQSSRPGRPRKNLEINAGGGFVVGASLNGTGEVMVNVVDLAGNPRGTTSFPTNMGQTLPDLAVVVGKAIRHVIEGTPGLVGKVKHAGLAIPAVVDSQRGTVHFMTTLLGGEAAPFAEIISNEIGLPVTIENETTCMARAEHWFGRAKALENFTLVHVGLAIGSAIYIDGLPSVHRGGLNPEIGHMKVAFGKGTRTCFCGGAGCVSTYCSMYGILEEAGSVRGLSFPPLTSIPHLFDDIMNQFANQRPAALTAVADAAEVLGQALANVVTVNDPGNLIVAFDSPRFLSAMKDPLYKAIETYAMASHFATTRVRAMVVDPDWRAKGTAALALEQAYLRD